MIKKEKRNQNEVPTNAIKNLKKKEEKKEKRKKILTEMKKQN